MTEYLPLNGTAISFFMKQSLPVLVGGFNNFKSKILVYIKEKFYYLKRYYAEKGHRTGLLKHTVSCVILSGLL